MSLEQELQQLDDFSSFLGLIGIILSIQSSQIGRSENKQKIKLSEKIIIVSVFIAACAAFIDLGTAKAAYDDLMKNKEDADPITISAAQDLLTSRLFSVLAAIYLIRATLKAPSGAVSGIVSPSGVVGV